MMSYRQVQDLFEINAFYADAAEHYDEDEKGVQSRSRVLVMT